MKTKRTPKETNRRKKKAWPGCGTDGLPRRTMRPATEETMYSPMSSLKQGGFVSPPLRNRIVPRTAPRIAAQDSPQRQPRAFQQTVFLQSLDSVRRTRRRITAIRPQMGRNGRLVKPDEKYRKIRQNTPHRSMEYVVPSLPSFRATPKTARRSRIRSDSAQSFAARAALRCSMNKSINAPAKS